jgi:hypothetical protein
MTDEEGVYQLSGSSPGTYKLVFSKAGYGAVLGKSLTLAAGAEVKDIETRLERPSSISGRVLDNEKGIVSGAYVTAWARSWRYGQPNLIRLATTTTDSMGKYQLTGLQKPRVYVSVSPPMLKAQASEGPVRLEDTPIEYVFAPTYYPNAPVPSGAAPVLVRAAENLTDFDIVIRKAAGHCVRGSLAANGTLTKGTLMLSEPGVGGSNSLGGGTVNAGEPFEICRVPEGSHVLYVTGFEEHKATSFFAMNVRIGKRDVDLGEIRLAPATELSGQLMIADAPKDRPVPSGIVLQLTPANRAQLAGEQLIARVDARGHFRFPILFPDEYRLTLVGPGVYVSEAKLAGVDVLHSPLFPGGGSLTVILANSSFISGRAVGTDGKTADDAVVVLISRRTGEVVSAVAVDQSGSFRLTRGVEPGEYRVAALRGITEDDAMDPDTIAPYLSRAVDVEVHPGGGAVVDCPVYSIVTRR